jgi:hypothetical protein
MQRRRVLRETIAAFERCAPPDRFHRLAQSNLARWSATANAPDTGLRLDVVPGDWGEVTREVTRKYGACFAVLNMANAYVPGGAYVEGAIAQEENMFRRTDCHFSIRADELDESGEYYRDDMTSLLAGRTGRVYLDTATPRVCVRGAEDRGAPDLGYPWLPDEEVFPFYELRASAQDLRGGMRFDEEDARRRIAAQLDTLRSHGIRHAVLGAFGCGAFRNPAPAVARIYRDEIAVREQDFSVLVFAIFAAGYGPDNYTPFRAVLRDGA